VSVIARALLEEKRSEEKLELRGIYFDGEVYPGAKGVEQVSRLPTHDESLGILVASALSPGRMLAGILAAQAARIAAILKTVEEKAKETEKEPAAPAA
jgi:ribosomal protein L10